MSRRALSVAATGAPINRGKLIGKVHVAKAKLGLDDDAYRDLLEAATGKRSAADCSTAELVAALKAFEKAGFKSASPAGGKAHVEKVKELWAELCATGAVGKADDAALRAFVHRQTGVSAPTFLNAVQANKVIEGLKAWLKRAKASP